MNHEQTSIPNWFRAPGTVVFVASSAIIGLFAFTEHRAHLFGLVPYLLLLACAFITSFCTVDMPVTAASQKREAMLRSECDVDSGV